ncbi:MAG: 3-oxoacyl-ACP reductase FabG [Kiritimatiellaeota bacterium]|nr:3-oxoacyl-ACP reductase FabG [Kiritimatiellota bacterium]
MIPIDLAGKSAIITGSGQGLGARTAALLAQAGANVVINYFNDPQGINLQRAKATAESIGNQALTIEADVRDPAAVDTLFNRTLDRFGRVDIVVNNAGILRDRSIKKMTPAEWKDVIDTNLTGAFNVCKSAAEKIGDGGRIVNVSSIAAFHGFFGQCNYAAAKGGIASLTKVLCRELAKRNITVNAVAPGVVLTEMGKTIPEAVRQEMLKSIPLGRFGEPEEIASVILFLCSDLAAYVTGQTIHVSGGWWV